MSDIIGTITAPPAISTAHITGSPVTTILGVTLGLQTALSSLPGGAFPTNSAGWAQFLMGAALAVFGALSKG